MEVRAGIVQRLFRWDPIDQGLCRRQVEADTVIEACRQASITVSAST